LGISAAVGPWAKRSYRKVKVAENLARLRTVASAGLGSGFSFLLFLALWELWEGTWGSIFLNLSTITLVAIGMVVFVEPLTEWIRERIGLEKEETVWKHDHRWHLRGAAVVILAAASLAHGLLHDNLSKEGLNSVGELFLALLIPASITCAWIVGAKSPTWRAPWLGAIAGLVLGIGLPLLVVWILSVDDVKMWIFADNGMKWGVAGLLGGLAIEHSRGQNHIHWTAGVIIAAFVFASLYSSKDLADIFKDLFISIGWAGGMLAVEPLALHCLRPTTQAILVKAPAVG
jgi:hypothetical protein